MKKNMFLKTLLIALSFFFLSACDSGSGGEPAVQLEQEPVPDDVPPQTKKISWGEAECQKSGRCENIVLNTSQSLWFEILNKTVANWRTEQETFSKTQQEVAVSCGASFHNSYVESINQVTELSDEDRYHLIGFAESTLVISTCQVKGDLKQNMDAYLQENMALLE